MSRRLRHHIAKHHQKKKALHKKRLGETNKPEKPGQGPKFGSNGEWNPR